MLPEFLITFRESLEAALVVGIVLAYLERTRNTQYNRHVYLGIIAGLVASMVLAVSFESFAGGFQGKSEEIFEGTVMLIASAMITWMILWMLKQEHVRKEIEERVKVEIDSQHAMGLVLFVFVAVLREGVETVIFLSAAAFKESGFSLFGALGGIVAAVILAFIIFETAIRVDLKTFFHVTSILLILFSAGLVAHAVHEFQEAGILEEQKALWDTKSILDDKSLVGSILRSLLGYNDNPTLYEVLGYLGYIALVFVAYLNLDKFERFV